MTAISIDKLIPVTSNVVNAGFTGVTLAGLFLTTNTLVPVNADNIVLSFTSAELVGNYFGFSSAEYTYSRNYFTSYTGKFKTPPFILFGRRVNAAVDSYIRGGGSPSLTALQAITSGAITFNFDGATQALTGINLSAAASLSAVAGIIQTALQVSLATATVVYNSTTESFVVNSGVTTGSSTITYCASTPLSDALKLTQATGAVLSQGSDALTVDENMTLITTVTTNWASLSTIYDAASVSPYTEALDICSWVTAQDYAFAYILWSLEANLLVVGNTSNIATQLAAGEYANVFPVYGSQAHAAFFMGMGASIDYNRQNGTISAASKSQSGLAASCTTDEQYDALIAKNFNFYGKFSARATEYVFSETGAASGQFLWIDNIWNNIWLSDYLQNAIATLFANAGRVPNNAKGYQQVKSALNSAMQQAIFNAVAETGNLFDDATKSVLQQQAGYDITPQLTNAGYVIQIVPVTSSQRATRIPPVCNIWYSNGGSINTLPVNLSYVF